MFKIYRIMQGDTLESISRNLGINLDELKRINGIVGNPMLIPGTNLIVPNREEATYITYTVRKGDTIYDIARRNNIDRRLLLLINGMEEDDYIYPDEQILIPRQDVGLYLTEQDDTISSISENLSITPEEMLELNDTIFLSPNQVIVYKSNENNMRPID